MSVREYMKFVIYRIASKGLEVFLIKGDDDEWQLPNCSSEINMNRITDGSNIIDLDDINKDHELKIKAKAVEADYHDIPSLRSLIKEDIDDLKGKVEEIVPDLSKGSFVAVKEAIKKVLPNEYQALKELKEIVVDRNQIINL